MRKSLIASTLAATLGGVSIFTGVASIPRPDAALSAKVEEYNTLSNRYLEAERRWIEAEKNNPSFVPQTERNDYSDSQAHSSVQRIYSLFSAAKSEVDSIVTRNPDLKDYIQKNNEAIFLVVLGGFFAGLGHFLSRIK